MVTQLAKYRIQIKIFKIKCEKEILTTNMKTFAKLIIFILTALINALQALFNKNSN